MYTKLEFKLENVDYKRLKGRFFEGYGETFRQYYIHDEDYLKELLLSKIKFHIEPDYITCCEITDYGADPHIDHNKVALNYYLSSANYVTEFWESTQSADGLPIDQLLSETTYRNEVRVYNYSELRLIDQFKAESHEAYLIDIKKIHSALKLKYDEETRIMIRWAWDSYNFKDIKSSIELL